MVNFEQAQRFKNSQKAEQKKIEEEKVKAEAEQKAAALEFLKTRKIFKDFVETPERMEQLEKCIEFLELKVLAQMVGVNDYTNSDWARGYRDGVESIREVVKNYNKYLEQYKQG